MPRRLDDYEIVRDPFDRDIYKIRPKNQGVVGGVIIMLIFGAIIWLSFNVFHTASSSSLPLDVTPFTSLSFYSKNPVLNEPLHKNSKGYRWETSQDKLGGSCQFRGGAYHASMPTPTYYEYCTAKASNFSNFAYQVKMMIVNGNGGGIIFRADSHADPLKPNFYYFYISATGAWEFGVYQKGSDNILIHGDPSSINTDLNQPYLIAVVANGNIFNLYVNNQQIESISDDTYSHGEIAVFASAVNEPTDVLFSDAKVWKL